MYKGLWELSIEHNPRRAYSQGPPNSLVTERRKKDEDNADAAFRVKREDFQRLNPDWYNEHITGNVPTRMSPPEIVPTNVPTAELMAARLCTECGVKPPAPKRSRCAACRKRSQRGD